MRTSDSNDAARRELEEETGVKVAELEQLYTAGDPGRDPRGWTVSVVISGQVEPGESKPVAADDAEAVSWFPLDDLPPLAFDHAMILDRARARLQVERPSVSAAESGLASDYSAIYWLRHRRASTYRIPSALPLPPWPWPGTGPRRACRSRRWRPPPSRPRSPAARRSRAAKKQQMLVAMPHTTTHSMPLAFRKPRTRGAAP